MSCIIFFFLHYHSNGQFSVCSQYPWITKKELEGPGIFQVLKSVGMLKGKLDICR